MTCTNCGSAIGVDSRFCDFCGIALMSHGRGPAQPPGRVPIVVSVAPGSLVVVKNPGLALVLSLFFPGAGQVYNGQIGKGVAMFAGYVVSWLLVSIVIGFVGAFVIWVWSMIDAYQNAKTTMASS